MGLFFIIAPILPSPYPNYLVSTLLFLKVNNDLHLLSQKPADEP
jgi:hypothetical protein